jgi:hypothetical protein
MSAQGRATAAGIAGVGLAAGGLLAFIDERPGLAVAAVLAAGGAWYYAHTQLQAAAAALAAAGQPAIDPGFVDSLQALLPMGGRT